MENFEVHAYLLKTTPSAHASERLNLLSQERGFFTVWYRHKGQPALAPFTPLWFHLEARTYGDVVLSMEPCQHPNRLTGKSLLAAWYMNELLVRLMPGHDADPVLYKVYEDTLCGLAHCVEQTQLEAYLRRFEWQLFKQIGYGMTMPLDTTAQYIQFSAEQGLVAADSGVPRQVCLSLSSGMLLTADLLQPAKQLTRQILDFLLEGRPLKTRAMFRSVHVAV